MVLGLLDDFNDLELSSEKYQTARAINITLGRDEQAEEGGCLSRQRKI